MKKTLFFCLFLSLGLMPTSADTFYVRPGFGSDTNGDGTLVKPWATLAKALASPTVVSTSIIDVSGTFTVDYNLSITKSVTIHGNDKSTTIFDGKAGNASLKNFTTIVTAGITLTLENITFKNFNNYSSSSSTNGGVVSINIPSGISTLTIKNCIFRDNTSNLGGAISVSKYAVVNVQDSYFYNNTAKATTSGTISNGAGGAIYFSTTTANSKIDITRCLFESNSAQGSNGAALYFDSSRSVASTYTYFLNLTNSTFTNNKLTYSTAATPLIGNGSVYVNNAGAFVIVKLVNNTIAYNKTDRTTNGGCSGLYFNAMSGKSTLINNLLFSNLDSQTTAVSTSILHNGNLLLTESRNNITDMVSTDYDWTTKTAAGMSSGNTSGAVNGTSTGQLGLATLLVDNGGKTKTLALSNSSIALNAGYVTGAPTVDQRNETRVGVPDVGAFESVIYLSKADSVGKVLCGLINLDYPGLELVKAAATSGDYATALEAWRDYKVMSLRINKIGSPPSSTFVNTSTYLPYAKYMIGEITTAQFLASIGCVQRNDFALFGFDSALSTPSNINWFTKNAAGVYPDVYSNFSNFGALAGNYYVTRDVKNLKKYFQIASDFASRQKKLYLNEVAKGVDLSTLMCNWSTLAAPALSEAIAVDNIIKSLAYFSKCLPNPNGGRPTNYIINMPVTTAIAKDSLKIIPAVELAQIALSLNIDHPQPLMDRYFAAYAVPNQRQSGLWSLIAIATQFPEFSTSSSLFSNTSIALDDLITGAMNKDGGMLEASFNYNTGVAAQFSDFSELLQASNPVLAQKFLDAQTDFYRLYASLLTPVGIIPALASSGPGAPPAIWTSSIVRNTQLSSISRYIAGQSDPVTASIAAAINPGNTKPIPTFTSIQYPYSGYYAQRKNWNWDSPYLFFYNRRPSRGHTNLGSNSIQISAFGRPLLVTAGKPLYGVDQLLDTINFKKADFNAINALFGEATSLKSNTVIVDDKSQTSGVISQVAYETPIDARWSSTSTFDFLEGNYDLGYPTAGKVDHRREVTFVKEYGFWIVADIMTNKDAVSHNYSQIWNFPGYNIDPLVGPSKCYGFKQNEVVLGTKNIHTADPTGPNVWMYHFGEKPIVYDMKYGQKNPYFGWYCPNWGEFIPAPQVFTKWTSANSSILITLIWPTNNNVEPVYSNMVDLSTKADQAYAGFSMTMQDGSQLKYEISKDNSTYTNDIQSFTAQSLLTVKKTNGNIYSLVTASTAPTVYEYNKINGVINDTKVISANSIYVYPNPVDNVLKIDSEQEIAKVEVYSMLGSMILSQKPANRTVNLSSLSSGQYIIKIHTSKNVSTFSINKK
ncbi:MAG: choice-of-anchor Q domain-containing protein [Paludibacter sp.]